MTAEQISSSYDAWIAVVRWAGTWIDLLLFGGTLFALLSLSEPFKWLGVGLWVVGFALYYPLLEGFTGKTLGKLVCGLTVVDAQGKKPGLGKALIRTLLRILELNPFMAGGIPAGAAVIFSKKHQRFGDMAANTFVLRSADLAYLSTELPQPPPSDALNLPRAQVAYVPPHQRIQPSVVQLPVPAYRSKLAGWIGALALLFTGLAVVLIRSGSIKFAEAARTKPVTLSCAQFMAGTSKNGWFRVTGCYLDLTDAICEYPSVTDDSSSTTGSSAEHGPLLRVYVPAFASEEHKGQKTRLVVELADDKTIKLVEKMRKLESGDEKKLQEWVLQHVDDLAVRRDVTGTIQSTFGLDSSVEGELDPDKNALVASEYVVVKDGDRPFAEAATSATAAGVMFCILAGATWLSFLVQLTGGSGPRRIYVAVPPHG